MDAELLKRHREKLGWSQKILAAKIGVDPQTISYWETERIKSIPKPVQLLLERIFKEEVN